MPEASRWRVDEGEEARITAGGPAAAEIVSQGYLPLRVRTPEVYRLRAAFPGTAVVLGDRTFEVVDEVETNEGVSYRLEPWPQGEVERDRVAYGSRFVRAAQAARERAAVRERMRPFRFLLYPLVGLLPETPQERLCSRLGLYAVTATLVSGLCEGLLLPFVLGMAGNFESLRPYAMRFSPLLVLLVVPGLGRAFAAAAFRETSGSPVVIFVHDALQTLGRQLDGKDQTILPLTREGFWARLALPDRMETEADGSLFVRALLPHLTWLGGRRMKVGDDYWLATALPPALHRARLTYSYRLTRLGDPAPPGTAPPGPSPLAYSEEVLADVAREWDDLMTAFASVVSMLPVEVQKRALDRRGGPPAIRKMTILTAMVSIVLALYLVYFLPGASGDPVAPLVAAVCLLLLVDAGLRLARASRGEYAPSLLRFVLPCDSLRPERIAYHAHRDAEREALDAFSV